MTVHKLIILMILVTMVITSALATEQSWRAQVLGIEPNEAGPNTLETLIHQHRAKILSGPYGSVSIGEVIQLLTEIPGGPETHQIFQALAVRKGDALPIVKQKLRRGQMWEKHLMTKLLRYSRWPEVYPELIALARTTDEHWLPRQGALYVLGALGDVSAGPEVTAILSEPNCPLGVQLVAISTLARIDYQKAASAIRQFAEHEDIHIRLFAYRALAEFGESVDLQFLLSALEDQDYVVRQEACGALAAVEDDDITQRLEAIAEYDFHESARTTARISLLDRKIRGRTPSEKLRMLRNALELAECRTAPWIIQTILDKCGPEGEAYVKQISLRDDRIGERARAFLIVKESSLSTSYSDQEIQTNNRTDIEPLHAATPTHQTLMEYATSKAASLETPLSFTGTQSTRMSQGSRDEDIPNSRCLDHGYRPIDNGDFPLGTTAHDESFTRWNSMSNAFSSGQFDGGDGVGAWHYLGRVSHLLQDMSSPLHSLAQGHAGIPYFSDNCQFEEYWGQNDSTLRSILNSIGGPLHSSDPLPSEATSRLDSFTQERLQYRYNNSCPQKNSDDVRGWIEVLAWTTYFRATFWGQVTFGTSGNGTSGPATSSQTTGTTFTDGYVGPKTNVLNTMFNGNVMYIDGWTDNYYEITDRQGYVFRWMSYTDIDDWSACGRTELGAGGWMPGYKDSSIRIGGSDDDDPGVRITGRFWFDTRELGKDTSGSYNRRCYPNKYPNGNSMTDDLHLFYGRYGYPLTVRYNAGLLGLANRRTTVKTNYGQANGFTWSRKDNFGNGPTFNASTSNSYFYFVAKSSVNLTAPQTNTSGESFVRWDKDGSSFSTNRTITINTSSSPIPNRGVVYTAVYNVPATSPPPPTLIAPSDDSTVYGESIDFSWSASSGANNYHMQLAYDSGFSNLAFDGDVGNTTSVNMSPFPDDGTEFYWRVKAGNAAGWSAYTPAWNFTSGETSIPDPPEMTSPTNGSNVSGTTIEFRWNASPGADNYYLQVATDSGFNNTIFDDEIGNYVGVDVSGFPDDGTRFYWHVKAGNVAGWSNYSDTWYFDNGTPPLPEKPINPSPAYGATAVSINTDLAWANGGGATSYDVYFGTEIDPNGAIEFRGNQTETSYDPGLLTYETIYYWRIDARNSYGVTTGDTWSFTTELAQPKEFFEDFETGDFSKHSWLQGCDAPWAITSSDVHEGTYAAQSGAISDEQQSCIELTKNVPTGYITFWRKVSSEEQYDWLMFYIDDSLVGLWSGEKDWAKKSYFIEGGTHTFKWAYEKNYSISEGSDCGWIDEIVFEPEPVDCALYSWADFHAYCILTSDMMVTPNSYFAYDWYYEDHWLIYGSGGGFTATFNSPADGQFELVVRHLSSASAGCPGGGYSPVTIKLNGDNIVSCYDPAENHAGTHGFVTDTWVIPVTAGTNTLEWIACDLCTNYWIQGVEIRYPKELKGDLDCDSVVDFNDVGMLTDYWLEDCTTPNWCAGCDIDKGGSVNFADFAELANHWFQATAP